MQLQTIHRIKEILHFSVINKILPLSLSALMLTSCSVSETHKEAEVTPTGVLTEAFSESNKPVSEKTETAVEKNTEISETEHISLKDKKVVFKGDPSSNEITEADFQACKEALESDGAFLLLDEDITAYDIDCDGKDEMIVLYGFYLFVFEKDGGEITETHRTSQTLSQTGNINLNLKTYSDGKEKYPYSTFHFDNTYMICDVLAAIKYDKESDSYYSEYIISWGKIIYGGDVSQFNHSFFRKSWDYTECAAGLYDSDISQEEFLEIYNKYEGLPPWDTYILEYDLME